MARLSAPYAPRRPEETALHALVSEHLGAFLQHARETYDGPLPDYVRQEFRSYLACGDFGRGFVHLRCGSCGDDLAVAFSCKVRGLCPSCAGRRMAGAAAHLVDRVLPAAPMRQYVLSLPYELSGLAATRAEVLTRLSRIFWEALRLRYARWAESAGLADASAKAKCETGAVTGVHRAGASLNVHVHFHLLCIDGVYVDEPSALRFVPTPAPTREELTRILERVHARVLTYLARRGLLRDPDASNAPHEPTAAEALTASAMAHGTVETVRDSGDADSDSDAAHEAHTPPRDHDAVTLERFNLHAAVALDADDDIGRERLCRYLTRPAFALARLTLRRDGLVAYRVKKASRRRVRVRIMTPIECLARLAAIVPPPRYPLLRFHGVLAPRHRLRAHIVPRAPTKTRAPCTQKEPSPPHRAERERAKGDGRAAFAPPVPTADLTASGDAERVGPSVLSIAHWERLLGGTLYAATSRIDWATLLRRTFEVDVRTCARCGGPVTPRAVVTETTSVKRLLDALRRSRAPPHAA